MRKAATVIVAQILLTLAVGCGDIPEYYGPLCDDAETAEWPMSSEHVARLDNAQFYDWVYDLDMETELRSRNLDGSWDFLSGNDIRSDVVLKEGTSSEKHLGDTIVSPYGKTMNALELIAKTPGDWSQTLYSGFAIHGSCGQKSGGTVAVTYWGRTGNRIDVYELFYNRNVVSRAGFLVHEAGHAIGVKDHANTDQDQRFDDHGPYAMQLEFLAAVYHNEEAPQAFRDAALAEFNWVNRDKFIETTGFTIEDFQGHN
jgi:hypothetical protein